MPSPRTGVFEMIGHARGIRLVPCTNAVFERRGTPSRKMTRRIEAGPHGSRKRDLPTHYAADLRRLGHSSMEGLLSSFFVIAMCGAAPGCGSSSTPTGPSPSASTSIGSMALSAACGGVASAGSYIVTADLTCSLTLQNLSGVQLDCQNHTIGKITLTNVTDA